MIDDRLQAHGAQVFEIQRCVKDLQCFTPAPGFESEALALFDIVLMRLKGAVDAGHGSDDILSLSGTWP